MASGALPTAGPAGNRPASAPPEVTSATSAEGIVHRQLDRTKLLVKMIDFGVLLALAGAALLAYFLVLAVVDHWLFSLGTFGRWLSLLGIFVGLGWLFARTCAVAIAPDQSGLCSAHHRRDDAQVQEQHLQLFGFGTPREQGRTRGDC